MTMTMTMPDRSSRWLLIGSLALNLFFVGTIGTLGHGAYQPLVDALTHNDRYLLCADFRSYVDTQKRAAAVWQAREEWTQMSILNTARSAYFSADRTIAEYARDIWRVKPVDVRMP